MIAVADAEKEILISIQEATECFGIDASVDSEYCPGTVIPSQVLLTYMRRIARKLDLIIPYSSYIFHDKKSNKQLSIKEASLKLLNAAQHG